MDSQEEINLPIGGTAEVSASTEKKPTTNAERQAKYAKKRKESRQRDAFVYDSKTTPTKPEAYRLLEARGLVDAHVIEVVYDLALKAVEQTGVIPNRFYFQNGIAKTLASYDQKVPQLLEAIPNEPIIGELSSRPELYALHDFSMAWREDAVDFAEFLRLRRLCKTDAYELGLLLGKDGQDGGDFEECQKNWTAFLPRFEPATLKPHYTQREMREWLDSIRDVKDYLILASRNAMKSSFVRIWLLTLHLCCPDARALLISETTKLSAGFIRKYRSYWEVKPNQETMLQKLFPEYCIPVGQGSKHEFVSPMAHLDLIQASATSTSMESVVAGGRAEVLLFDDPISNLSCGTEEQRRKSVDLFDLLQKLREVLGSFSVTVGTPWFADEDLYAVLLKRNEDSADKSLAVRIDPVVTVKREAQHKLTPALLPTLTPEDVESYLLPVRMPWRFVKREISANPTFALSQNFCIFPKDEDSGLRITFEETQLRAHTKPIGSFDEPGPTFLALDRAFSVARYADYSCIGAGKITQVNGKQALVAIDVRMDRWRESELVLNIVQMVQKHSPRAIVMEKDKGWQDLDLSIRRGLQAQGLPIPYIVWKAIPVGGQNARSKMRRIKMLELPLIDGRLWFVSSAIWNDPCFEQLVKIDGTSISNSHRKDDFPDMLSLLFSEFGPRRAEEIESTDQKNRDDEVEQERQAEQRRQHYQQMFGAAPGQDYQVPKPQEQPQPQDNDPRNKIFGNNGLSVMRRRG